MGTEAADSIGQDSAGIGSSASTSTDVAAGMVSDNRTAGTLDTTALAADVQARTANDPQAQADLTAALEAQMTPVERGQFSAAMQVANDNVAADPAYGVSIEGEAFAVGDFPDAPAASTWGSQPVGSGYKEAWDATAARLGTTDPAAITAEIEAQLTPPSQVTVLDPIVIEADAGAQSGNAPAGEQPAEEGIGSFFEGMVKGDFADNDSWSATAGQVIGGFIPVVGQIGDARDTVAAIGGVIQGEDGAWGNLGLAALGWVPGIGDAAKGALRGGEKALDAGTEVAEQVVRHGDDVARQADDLAGVVDDIPVRRFDNADKFNRVANNPAPNSSYSYGNFSYRTDAQGRVTEAQGRIEVSPAGRNDNDLQAQIGREGRPTDVGFHIFADRFGGQTNRLNVVPGNGRPIGDNAPNLNQGPYKRFENMLAELSADNRVDARIEMQYDPANATSRPDRFVAHYRVNDGDWVQQTFINK
jgi:hypothetical protein